jgi:hypothetical protein
MNVILDVLRNRYESVEEAHRIVSSNFMADLSLDSADDYMDGGDLAEAELAKTSPPEPAAAENPPTKLKF